MRIALSLALLALCACSGLSNRELRLRGDAQMNPNEHKQPNTVKVKVLMLKGPGAVTAFQDGDFDALWNDAAKVLQAEKLYMGPLTVDVLPGKEPKVPLEKVPAEVSHIGVLALFNDPVKGKDRVVIECAQLGDQEAWLHDFVIEARDPDAKPPAPAPKAEAPKGG